MTRPNDRRVESAELRRLRHQIDTIDRRIVALLNERAALAIRDAEREREVLLRVTMANEGPLGQADLLALYRRLMAATRALEARDRVSQARATAGPAPDPDPDRDG